MKHQPPQPLFLPSEAREKRQAWQHVTHWRFPTVCFYHHQHVASHSLGHQKNPADSFSAPSALEPTPSPGALRVAKGSPQRHPQHQCVAHVDAFLAVVPKLQLAILPGLYVKRVQRVPAPHGWAVWATTTAMLAPVSGGGCACAHYHRVPPSARQRWMNEQLRPKRLPSVPQPRWTPPQPQRPSRRLPLRQPWWRVRLVAMQRGVGGAFERVPSPAAQSSSDLGVSPLPDVRTMTKR